MGKRLRKIAGRIFFRVHELGLKLNLFILPKHFYVPLADITELHRTRERWAKPSAMVGVKVDLDAQARVLRELVKPFQAEYKGNAAYHEATTGAFGLGYGYIEAQALHGVLRALKPKRIIEVGSGVSTFCMLKALEKNAAEGADCVLTCIEPYPSEWLRQAPVKLIVSPLQDVDPKIFEQLEDGDFLFIDSSHTVKIDSDVDQLILEILPRLKVGTTIHVHDIFLPYDFQRNVFHSLFQWMESAMLHAFLIGNQAYEILFCLSHLHYDRREALEDVFPEYVPQPDEDGLASREDEIKGYFPSSIYLKVVAPLT